MGQVCSFCSDSANAERSKQNAFIDREGKSLLQYYNEVEKSDNLTTDTNSDIRGENIIPKSDSAHVTSSSLLGSEEERQRQAQIDAEAERRRVVLEEQARLERIVSTAGREMMSVNRRDGYYDPGYAAAVAQNILKGGLPDIDNSMNKCLVGVVPSTSVVNPNEVLEVLSRGRWEGIMLGQKGGLGGCGGEDPNIFFDDCAEGFLAAMLPTKKVFHESEPIVENLP